MNQRIRQLIEQATKVYEPEWNGDVGFEEFDKEKFAELIVRECASIADDGFASSNFGNGITGHQLLKHFGVEE